MANNHHYDVLIIGSGAAGLSTALMLPESLKIGVLAKARIKDGSTLYAQGGISAVLEPFDSTDAHAADTIMTGAGLCNEAVVNYTTERGAEIIQWLASLGMPFTRDKSGDMQSGYHLTREGGHSQRRVIHTKDATGAALEATLINHSEERQNITLIHDHIAIDLITSKPIHPDSNRVLGAYAYNKYQDCIDVFHAPRVILATGGASKVYLYTSNPDSSTGDGIAMAWRAGCSVGNMEFIQFHPTCLYHPDAKSFLITEAVRGEGGKLLLPNGQRFMDAYDERAELAPRDIVARAIDQEMKRLGTDCLYLDISHKSKAFITSHFPTIYKRCLGYGIDMTKEPLPIVPAAHYTCGGIVTDTHGRTDINNLYAVGEAAFTGLHGANRMASNSLLECLVFAEAAVADIKKNLGKVERVPNLPPWDESRVTDSDEEVVVSHNWDEMRRFMWDYVGIVRTDKRLQRAKNRVALLKREINEYYENFRVSNDLIELRNLVVVADLIIESALRRKESRGLHYTLDHPDKQATAKNTILTPRLSEQSTNNVIALNGASD